MAAKHQAGVVLAGIVLLVCINVAVRYQPYTFIRRDGSFYATIAMGLLKEGSLDQRRFQPQSWYTGEHPGYPNLDANWSNVSVGRHGVWYPKHSFLIAIAAVPFYAAFGVDGLLLFNAFCVVGMLWAGYLMAVRFGGPLSSAIAVIVTAGSPMIVEHTYHLSADVFSAALIAVGALSLFAMRPRTAGVLLGIALWARPVTAVLVIPVTGAICWRRFGRREVVHFVVALAVPLLAAAATNTIMYGAPWITSYDRILTVDDRVQRVVSARSLFTNTWSEGLRLMFDDRENGLTANALSGLISLVGLLALWRRHRLLAGALAAATLGFLVTYVHYRYFNARFFFAWQVLLCIPLAVLIADLATLGRWAGTWAWALLSARASRARGWLARRSRPALVLAAGAVIAGVVLVRRVGGGTYALARHITDAKVYRNGFPCDYFNITHQAWECSRLDRSDAEYPGLSLLPTACRFGGVHRDMLRIAPPVEGGSRRLRFEQLPRGELKLSIGQDGSGTGDACLSVSYGGRSAQRLCVQGSGQLKEFAVPEPEPGQPRVLELEIEGSGPQTMCFDGVIRR